MFKINVGKEFFRNDKDLRLIESLWLKIKFEKVNNKEINLFLKIGNKMEFILLLFMYNV